MLFSFILHVSTNQSIMATGLHQILYLQRITVLQGNTMKHVRGGMFHSDILVRGVNSVGQPIATLR